MEIHLDSVTGQIFGEPESGTVEQWNEAYDRLRDYLDAYQLGDRLHEARLIVEILEAAVRRHAEEPELEPVEVTLMEARERVDTWFAQILESRNAPEDIRALAGALAYYSGDFNREEGGSFLRQNVAERFQKRMNRSALRTGPDLEISSMTSRSFDYGPLVQARDTLQKAEWAPVLRAFLQWAFVYFIVYFGWYHFIR